MVDVFDETLADRIYEAAVVPELWPDVLGEMSSAVGGDGAVLFTANRVQTGWTTSPDLHDTFIEFVRDGWAAINPRPVRLGAANHAGFVRDSDFFSEEEMNTDPVYGYYRRKAWLGLGDRDHAGARQGDGCSAAIAGFAWSRVARRWQGSRRQRGA